METWEHRHVIWLFDVKIKVNCVSFRYNNDWIPDTKRHSNPNDLSPIIFYMELTHLGSEATQLMFLELYNLSIIILYKLLIFTIFFLLKWKSL